MQGERKHSAKRDAILSCIRSTNCHPTAEWVYQRLKPEIPDLSLATVYRNLNLFRAQGLVMSVGTVAGLERFDGSTHPHAHFVCDGCGAVLDLPGITLPDGLLRQAEDAITCTISRAALQLRGLCNDCTNKKF